MKKILTYIIVITVSVVVGIGIGMFNLKRRLLKGDNIQSDTTTVIVYDTVRVKIPEPASARSVGIEVYPVVQVPILLYHSDTITKPYFVDNDLVIPISQRYYKDNRYEAWISGYNPRLDSLLILTPTKTVTIENTRENTARNQLYLSAQLNYIHPFPAMSIGVQAGFNRDRWGLSIGTGGIVTPSGLKWYGQVGLEYDLFTKKW